MSIKKGGDYENLKFLLKQRKKINFNFVKQKKKNIMDIEELMKLEHELWRFKLEKQLHCSKREKEALVTTLVLLIDEIQKANNERKKR